ncbi:MAG: hypothetical protein IKO65_03555 [Victivallales bacterium]|nr:hypothetical protein [Victivallales bacterium]
MTMTATTIAIIVLGVLFVLLAFISYVKAPPDKAFIISGLRRRTIIGAAGFRVPFLERLDKITLELIQVDVKTSDPVPNADFINVNVDAVVNIKIGKTPEMLEKAAMNFLNASPKYISDVAKEVLEGNMREIVGQMHTKEMVLDRQKFADMVKANADPDLARMGLEIVSFNVQNFNDNDSAIENLGIDNIAQISKDAAIARAQAERDVAIAKANAEKEANDANVLAQTEIAKRQNELAIKKAELKREADTQLAIAESAKSIQAEEQRKIIEMKTGDADVARQMKAIEIKEREVEIAEKKLDAEIRKTAEAKKFAVQQEADAKLYSIQKEAEADLVRRQKNAEAEKFEAERKAEAQKAIAEAERVKGENEAQVIAAKGNAEADAIKAKALAEAEGILKKAEAMKEYQDAAKLDLQLAALKLYFEKLPDVAKAVADGYSSVDKIVVWGDNGGKLVDGMTTNITKITEVAKEALGLDVGSFLNDLGARIAKSKDSSDDTAPKG